MIIGLGNGNGNRRKVRGGEVPTRFAWNMVSISASGRT